MGLLTYSPSRTRIKICGLRTPADIDAAVAGAMIAKMRNGGAACTAANRFIVAKKVATEFTDKFAKAMSALKVAPGLDDGAQLGASVSIKERNKIAELVDASVKAEIGRAHV